LEHKKGLTTLSAAVAASYPLPMPAVPNFTALYFKILFFVFHLAGLLKICQGKFGAGF